MKDVRYWKFNKFKKRKDDVMPGIYRLSKSRSVCVSIAILLLFCTAAFASDFIRVIAPNGGEVWQKGSAHVISWWRGDIDPNKQIKIIARKGGRRYRLIATSTIGRSGYLWHIPEAPDDFPPGDDYKIVVKTSDGTLRDSSDNNFTILSTSEGPPHVDSFRINNGAESTGNPDVILNHTITGTPTRYRACENNSFSGQGCGWKPYNPTPTFTLSTGIGTKTVWFQVKNQAGVSNKMSDSISVVLARIEVPGTVSPIRDDPSIKNFDLLVKKVYGKYSIDFDYEVKVPAITLPGNLAQGLRIILEAIPYRPTGRGVEGPVVLKTLEYVAGSPSGSDIIHRGSITYHFSRIGPPDGVQGVTIRARLELLGMLRDANTNNNKREYNFGWTRKNTISLSHDIKTCLSKDDWSFTPDIPGSRWITGSYLEVLRYDRAYSPLTPRGMVKTTVYDESVEYDANGSLPLGRYGYRWIKHPETDSLTGKVHAWCEGDEHHGYTVLINYYEVVF